jgi:DNA polymerase I-like protein with 3'-5' exonuclease and polymerase domains
MFQDLREASHIAIDLETKDPQLKERGSGALRDGEIVGVAIATDTGIREYYSIAHLDSQNLDKEKVFAYLRTELARSHQAKVGANLLYDLEYLAVNDITVKGPIYDVLIAEPLIDENQFKYSLELVAQKYLKESKKTDTLETLALSKGLKGNPREHIWKFTANEVAPYAIGDVDLPLRIFKEQTKIIHTEELEAVFDVESRLLPLLLQMKLTGCRIDVQKAVLLKDKLTQRKNELFTLIKQVGLDPSSTDASRQQLAHYLIEKNVSVPFTKKTKKPSITAEYLKTVDTPEVKWILEHKRLEKFIGTFLQSQILDSLIDDRIHAQFNSLRDSDGGTVTGRFSSSRPNLQNIPSRNSELAPLCRGLFIPEEGHLFGSIDYSQIEYRILCHFAMGNGSTEIRKAFNENPNLDVHQWCADFVGLQGKEGRSLAKAINFGVIYGQGAKKTAQALGLDLDAAKSFLQKYNEKMPFAKTTAKEAMYRAERRGWVKTILGRRRRFNLYEPQYDFNSVVNWEERPAPLLYSEACEKFGPKIKRAMTHKALNAIVQGSSADLIKLAMVTAYEAGIFNVLIPLTTVHDELNVSIPQTNAGKEAFKELVHIMQTCYVFRVPIIAEAGTGNNWTEAKYHG